MEMLQFEVLTRDDHLDLDPGTHLVVDLARLRMWTATRIYFPNLGYVAGMLAEGRLRWITCRSVLEATPPPAFPLRVVA